MTINQKPFAKERFSVDSFMSERWPENYENLTGGKIARCHKLMGVQNPMEVWNKNIGGILLRARFCDSPYPPLCVESEEKLTPKFIHAYVNSLDETEWKNFLKKATL